MKTWPVFFCAAALLVQAGCSSLATRVTQRFTGVPPKVHVFAAAQKETFAATLAALKDMDYTIDRSGAAQGIVKAHNRIISTDDLQGARQLAVSIQLSPSADGGTEMDVWLSEIVEDNSRSANSLPTETPLPDHGFYDALFAEVQQFLSRPAGR